MCIAYDALNSYQSTVCYRVRCVLQGFQSVQHVGFYSDQIRLPFPDIFQSLYKDTFRSVHCLVIQCTLGVVKIFTGLNKIPTVPVHFCDIQRSSVSNSLYCNKASKISSMSLASLLLYFHAYLKNKLRLGKNLTFTYW